MCFWHCHFKIIEPLTDWKKESNFLYQKNHNYFVEWKQDTNKFNELGIKVKFFYILYYQNSLTLFGLHIPSYLLNHSISPTDEMKCYAGHQALQLRRVLVAWFRGHMISTSVIKFLKASKWPRQELVLTCLNWAIPLISLSNADLYIQFSLDRVCLDVFQNTLQNDHRKCYNQVLHVPIWQWKKCVKLMQITLKNTFMFCQLSMQVFFQSH